MSRHRTRLLGIALSVSACGATPPADDGERWETVVAADWELEAGEERLVCVRMTPPEGFHLRTLRALAPLGTHHAVLLSGAPLGPDGVFECDPSGAQGRILFAAGVATNDVELPDGVGLAIERGVTLVLNLHLFNTTDQAIRGRSGVDALVVAPEAVEHEAEVILAGKQQGLVVEPGRTTQVGHCTMPGDATILAIMPHMHGLGAHLEVVAERASADEPIFDAPYAFGDQQYTPMEDESLAGGERLRVECTYENPGPDTVRFGDSTRDEMCFAAVLRYPKAALAVSLACTH